MPEPFDLTIREARRRDPWDRWQHRLKPWALPATVLASIGVIVSILGDKPGLGLVALWIAIPVLVIGAGVER